MDMLVSKVAVIFMLAVGFSFMIQAREWVRYSKRTIDAPDRMFSLALLMVILGGAIVAVHNDWTLDWRLAITAYGWAVLLKGLALLIVPRFGGWLGHIDDGRFQIIVRVGGIILSAIGLVLLYQFWLVT